MSNASDGQGLYDDGVNTAQLISAVLNRDVEMVDEDGAVDYENTVDIPSMTTKVGATITINDTVWSVGRTIKDDGSIKTVVVQK